MSLPLAAFGLGLKREARVTIALVCTFCDTGLFALWACGFGELITRAPMLTHIAAWAGALFLMFYGGRLMKRIIKRSSVFYSDPCYS